VPANARAAGRPRRLQTSVVSGSFRLQECSGPPNSSSATWTSFDDVVVRLLSAPDAPDRGKAR